MNGRIDLTPVYDGDFFPAPIHVLREEAPPKPLMTGITEVEGLLFSTLIHLFMRTRIPRLTSRTLLTILILLKPLKEFIVEYFCYFR